VILYPYSLAAVFLEHANGDALVSTGWDVLAYIVGPYRQFTMTAINQDGQLDLLCPAHLGERVEGGAYRAPGVEDVVNDHHALAFESDWNAAVPRGLLRAKCDVVAERADVEHTDGNLDCLNVCDDLCDSTRQVCPAGVNAHKYRRAGATLSLQDLVSDAPEGPADVVGGHDLRHRATSDADGGSPIVSPCRPHWTVC